MNSLKTKVIFYFSGFVVLIVSVFGYLLYYVSEENIKEKVRLDLYSKAIHIEKALIQHKDFAKLNKLKHYEFKVIKNGKTIFKTNDFQDIKTKANFYFQEIDEYNILALYRYTTTTPYKVTIIIYKNDIYNKAEDIEDTLFILIPLLAVVLILLSIKATNKIIYPITELTNSINKLSINQIPNRLNTNKDFAEFKHLINSYNIMVDRLKAQVQRLDSFNQDISHELKTPLTIIKGEIEYILNKKRSNDEYKNSLISIKEEVDWLNQMVNNILFLAKYDKSNIKQTFIKIYLDSMVLDIVSKYEKAIKKNNIKLELNIQHIQFNSNQMLLNTIFINLIDNGIKYTKDYLQINLYKQDKITFEVVSNGKQLTQSQINKLTQPFYKIDSSRSTKGFGLGLSIVKNSASLLDAQMNIISNSTQNIFKILL